MAQGRSQVFFSGSSNDENITMDMVRDLPQLRMHPTSGFSALCIVSMAIAKDETVCQQELPCFRS